MASASESTIGVRGFVVEPESASASASEPVGLSPEVRDAITQAVTQAVSQGLTALASGSSTTKLARALRAGALVVVGLLGGGGVTAMVSDPPAAPPSTGKPDPLPSPAPNPAPAPDADRHAQNMTTDPDDCAPMALQYVLHMAESGKSLAESLDAAGLPDVAAQVRRMTDVKQLPDDIQWCVMLDRRSTPKDATP